MWQIVEKEDFGTDWHPVRYENRALQRFDTEEAAKVEASRYLTIHNCDNALTKEEKSSNVEMFMMDDTGAFLGVLDKVPWYMTYPKDIKGRDENGAEVVKYAKGEPIQDKKFFMLEGKTEVAVRTIPGT